MNSFFDGGLPVEFKVYSLVGAKTPTYSHYLGQ